MLIETWLIQHAAEMAEQAVTHLAAAATAIQHETHVLLEEITGLGHTAAHSSMNGPVDAGCAEN
jgi:hypothetical protein